MLEGDPRQLDPELFNAIGSRCVGSDMHLPVLDADGGCKIQITQRKKSRCVIFVPEGQGGKLPTDTDLPELFSDYGIGFDVRQVTSTNQWQRGLYVSRVILDSSMGAIHAQPSATRGHGHVYIQTPMSANDHRIMLDQLAGLGVVDPRWAEDVVRVSGDQGVVRTPWHPRSNAGY